MEPGPSIREWRGGIIYHRHYDIIIITDFPLNHWWGYHPCPRVLLVLSAIVFNYQLQPEMGSLAEVQALVRARVQEQMHKPVRYPQHIAWRSACATPQRVSPMYP